MPGALLDVPESSIVSTFFSLFFCVSPSPIDAQLRGTSRGALKRTGENVQTQFLEKQTAALVVTECSALETYTASFTARVHVSLSSGALLPNLACERLPVAPSPTFVFSPRVSLNSAEETFQALHAPLF